MIVRIIGPRNAPPDRVVVMASLDALNREVGIGGLVAAEEPGVEAMAREWAVEQGIAVYAIGTETPDALIVLQGNRYTERLEAEALGVGTPVMKAELAKVRKPKAA